MKVINKIKEGSQRLRSSIREQAMQESPKRQKKNKLNMEWDKIYVEIDNDANGTVAAENLSPTQRRRNHPIAESDSDESGSVSKLLRNGVEGGTTKNDSKTTMTREQSNDSITFDTTKRSSESETIETRKTEAVKYLSNNHFANAQLLRLQVASEEGPCLAQTALYFSALGSIIIALAGAQSVSSAICAFYTTVSCLIIMLFESRICGSPNPRGCRSKLRNFLVRHLSILRLLWGRGLLFIFAGTMAIATEWALCNFIVGGLLVGLGFLAIMMGAHAVFSLERLRLSLTDPIYLWNKFQKSDSDHDNLLDLEDFSHLIWKLGLELDDAYTARAFHDIDRDQDGLITFHEFKFWWVACEEDDGTIVSMDVSKLTMEFGSRGSWKEPAYVEPIVESNAKEVPFHIRTDVQRGSGAV